MQLHTLAKDGFISKHIDSESSSDYQYSLVTIYDSNCEGGEFFIKNKNNKYIKIDSQPKAILFDSNLEHSVGLIKQGFRKTITCLSGDA